MGLSANSDRGNQAVMIYMLVYLVMNVGAFLVVILVADATGSESILDYKGLANIGTWFLGRLQTERDRERLMEGLDSASGGFDRKKTEDLLSSLSSGCS